MKTTTTRDEHLAWCKKRALEYCDAGEIDQAFASMASDLDKHPGTVGHSGMVVGSIEMLCGRLGTPEAMRRFIEGFN